jgi:hypothetical protein
MTVSDGDAFTVKRQVLCSSCLTGPYSYHSTILDLSSPPLNYDDGLMYNGAFANGTLFTLANKLYFMSSGQTYNLNSPFAGDYYNHCNHLWSYDNNLSTWSITSSPILCSPHSTTLFGFNWGYDHMGAMVGFVINDNKLWWIVSMSGGTDTYQITNGYYDLSEICTTTTTSTTEYPYNVYYEGDNVIYDGDQVIFTS